MKKERSKQKFFNKLSFLLSFYFNNTESTSILNDYRNLFENEASQGKTEDEICSDLEPPIKIVKKLSSQTSSNSSKLFIFSHNIILQILFLIIVRLFTEIVLLKICNEYSLNYIYFAIVINFIYFTIGMILIKEKSNYSKIQYYKGNLLILSLTLIMILFQVFLTSKLTYSYSGKICTISLSILSFFMFIISLYFIICKIIENKQSSFFITMNLLEFITLSLFFINELHMLYNSIPEYINFAFKGIYIYVEIIILDFIFYIKRIHV